MYAIIEACGKQYKVVEGDVVFFEKLDTEAGKKVTFDNVILVSDEKGVQVGNPYVKGVKVEGKVVAHGKGKKIIVFKMKVEITAIKTPAAKTEKTAEKVEKAEATEKKTTTAKKTTTTKTATKKAETK